MKPREQHQTKCAHCVELHIKLAQVEKTVCEMKKDRQSLRAGQIASQFFKRLARKLGKKHYEDVSKEALLKEADVYGLSETDLIKLEDIKEKRNLIAHPEDGDLNTFPKDVQSVLKKAERAIQQLPSGVFG